MLFLILFSTFSIELVLNRLQCIIPLKLPLGRSPKTNNTLLKKIIKPKFLPVLMQKYHLRKLIIFLSMKQFIHKRWLDYTIRWDNQMYKVLVDIK